MEVKTYQVSKDISADIRHVYAFAIEKSIDKDNRRMRFVISSDKLDRHNERIEVSAVANAIAGFTQNPAFVAAHKSSLATGSSPCLGHWDVSTFKALKHHSEMTVEFATTALGEEHWNLYSNKHQRAVSIAFMPKEYYDEKDEKLDWIRTFIKIELLEISAVVVGACREALAKARLKELFGDFDLPAVIKEALRDIAIANESHTKEQLDNFAIRIEDSLDEIKSLLVPDPGRLAQEYVGDPDEQPALAKDRNIADRQIKSLEKAIKSVKN